MKRKKHSWKNEKEDSSKIWGSGIGAVYVGAEVPNLEFSISPPSPNEYIVAITVDATTEDKDDAAPVDMTCDLRITEYLTDAFGIYNMTQSPTGTHTVSVSDIFLGNAEMRVDCIPDSLNYTRVHEEADYIFGDTAMKASVDVDPDLVVEGETVTISATTY